MTTRPGFNVQKQSVVLRVPLQVFLSVAFMRFISQFSGNVNTVIAPHAVFGL